MNLPDWTREPLVHFLVAGALIFALFSLQGEEIDPASRTIDIDRETQAQIALGFERLMSRPPTDAELDAQIERYVREEVLYREALRLGLDADDAIVRRRLAQKMDMLASARAETEQPSEATLQEWLEQHPERFASDTRYSLDQLWFAEETAARSVQGSLSGATDWQSSGERISLPSSLENEPRRELLDQFGAQFVSAIDGLELGDAWQGPVTSGLGWHLVRLRDRSASSIPALSDIREDVENDWRSRTIDRRRDEAYQLLREAYTVSIER